MPQTLFARSLARLRKLTRLTQKELGALVGLSEQTIKSFETRSSIPGSENLNRLRIATGVYVEGLFKGEILTFDFFEYTHDFFLEYAKGERVDIERIKKALFFDLEQILLCAEEKGFLLPSLTCLNDYHVQFANRMNLTKEIYARITPRRLKPIGEGKYATIEEPSHISDSRFLEREGKDFIPMNNSKYFGAMKNIFHLSLYSKALFWPYESDPEELTESEIKRWLSKRTLEELKWIKINEPYLKKFVQRREKIASTKTKKAKTSRRKR